SQKCKRRQQIASIMLDLAHRNHNTAGIELWSFVLKAVTALKSDGMSDEESDDGNGSDGPNRKVLDIDFRHPDFQELLQKVDCVPKMAPQIFNRSGRKYMRRVHVEVIEQRVPPPDLPVSFYRAEYLAKIKRGEVLPVTFGVDEYPVSRYFILPKAIFVLLKI
ncbi:hypothetical protein BT96DRAFT_844686, partial [Gymnopus androsaceus JB14]